MTISNVLRKKSQVWFMCQLERGNVLSNFEGIILKMSNFLWIFQNISKFFRFIGKAHFVHSL